MILWEMASMTKPFEMMGREDFYQEVVSATRIWFCVLGYIFTHYSKQVPGIFVILGVLCPFEA